MFYIGNGFNLLSLLQLDEVRTSYIEDPLALTPI